MGIEDGPVNRRWLFVRSVCKSLDINRGAQHRWLAEGPCGKIGAVATLCCLYPGEAYKREHYIIRADAAGHWFASISASRFASKPRTAEKIETLHKLGMRNVAIFANAGGVQPEEAPSPPQEPVQRPVGPRNADEFDAMVNANADQVFAERRRQEANHPPEWYAVPAAPIQTTDGLVIPRKAWSLFQGTLPPKLSPGTPEFEEMVDRRAEQVFRDAGIPTSEEPLEAEEPLEDPATEELQEALPVPVFRGEDYPRLKVDDIAIGSGSIFATLFLGIRNGPLGDAWVFALPASRAMGVNWAGQHRRLTQADYVVSGCICKMQMQLPGDTQSREHLLIRAEKIGQWLMQINTNRLGDAAAREQIRFFQAQAGAAIDRWLNSAEPRNQQEPPQPTIPNPANY